MMASGALFGLDSGRGIGAGTPRMAILWGG